MKLMRLKFTRIFETQFEDLVSRGILSALVLVAIMLLTFAGLATAQDGRTGKIRQPIVGGGDVLAVLQEQYGLVTLSSGCSGSLLRNNWVVTAAHCVDNPDPANAGQFIMDAENSITLTASWKSGVQERKSARIISFRPNDVAIIRIAEPFTSYVSEGYNRGIYRESLKSVSIIAFGRGINRFAQGSGASAMPSQRDGLFRVGYFSTDSEDSTTYGFPTGSQTIAGGDSGGPSYVKTSSGDLLAGVHSLCESVCMPGKMCAAPSAWAWVIATPRCTDASIAPLWDEIDRYLGAFVPAPRPVLALGKVKSTTSVPSRSICESARAARARNSPAAPGLEAQCRAAGAAGEIPPQSLGRVKTTPTDAPPISICESARAARGRNSPAAPGLEARCRALLAGTGAGIAGSDPILAQSRTVEPDVLYSQGFDIATAIFGDPALGAQGNTAAGPGSVGIRDTLSFAGRRGFDASMRLHLSRKYVRASGAPDGYDSTAPVTQVGENSTDVSPSAAQQMDGLGWLAKLIKDLRAAPPANPPALIRSYSYRNQKVYYLRTGCCDQYSPLFDESGKVICSPDGGRTGRGDGKCSDFSEERKEEKLIWKDTRSHE